MTLKREHLWLWGILILGILAKPFFWRAELLGNFSSYQTVFGMIAGRCQAAHFHNLFRPELFLLENGRPALELIFFPLVSVLAAGMKALFSGPLDAYGRFVSVAASTLNTLVLYRLWAKRGEKTAGLFAAFFFSFAPYVWVYGRNFQNEALAALFLSLTVLMLDDPVRVLSGRRIALSALCFGLSVTLRFHFLLLTPAFLAVFLPQRRFSRFAVWLVLAGALPAAWHAHAWLVQQTSDSVHTTLFMQTGAGKTFPHPLLLQSGFYLKLFRDLVFWCAGPLGLVCAMAALRGRFDFLKTFSLALLGSAFLIPILIPQKFTDQHFYFYPAAVPLSLLAGAGAARISAHLKRPVVAVLVILSFLLSLVVSWRPAFDVPAKDRAVLQTGRFIRSHVPADARIIAAHGSSGDLLFYGDRLGWGFSILPARDRAISVYMKMKGLNRISNADWETRNRAYADSVSWLEYLRGQGAEYFITSTRAELDANPGLLRHLKSNYSQISGNDSPFYGFQLTPETKSTRRHG